MQARHPLIARHAECPLQHPVLVPEVVGPVAQSDFNLLKQHTVRHPHPGWDIPAWAVPAYQRVSGDMREAHAAQKGTRKAAHPHALPLAWDIADERS